MRKLVILLFLAWSEVAVSGAASDPTDLLSEAKAAGLIGNLQEATKLYSLARQIYASSGDLAGIATIEAHLSDLALRSRELDKALQHRRSAYRLFQRAGKGLSQALALREVGILTAVSLNASRGREMIEHSIQMCEYLGAREETHRAHATLLLLLHRDPNVRPSLIVDKARALLETERPKPAPEHVVYAHDSLGYAYAYLGDYETAVACYEKAASCARGSTLHHAAVEMTRANLASALIFAGRYREASKLHSTLAESRLARGDKAGAIRSHLNASVAFRYDGRLELAERYLETAQELASELGLDRADLRYRFELNRGRIAYERGDNAGACQHYQRASSLALPVSQDVWKLHYFYALALERADELEQAERELRVALSEFERVRGRISEFRQRAAYSESRGDVYALLVALLARQSRIAEAFETVEQHKARTFLDLIVARPATGEPVISQAQPLTRSAELTLGIAALGGHGTGRGFAEALQDTVSDAATGLEEALAKMAAEPDTPLPASQRAMKLPEIQRSLRHTECVLEYYLDRDQAYAFVVTTSGIKSWTTGIGRENVGTLVDDWRHEIVTRRSSYEPRVRGPAEETLYVQFLAPAVDVLLSGDHDTVYIVPDGPLHYLSFQALRSPDGQRLIDHLAVAYVPSASSMARLSEMPGAAALETLLAVANPANDLPPLPFALQEAERVGKHFGRQLVLTGKDAQKRAVVDALPQYDAVLFAVHGKMNPALPTESSLILAGSAGSPDCRLTVSDIASLRLRAGLVLLSACESGLASGRTKQFPMGDDVEGLARAFMLAGVPTVVATLWHVPDRATALLIEEFVRRLKTQGLPPAEALRQAQVRMLGQAETRPPYYWAGVCAYGLNREKRAVPVPVRGTSVRADVIEGDPTEEAAPYELPRQTAVRANAAPTATKQRATPAGSGESGMAAFVDAGGRFRCIVPTHWQCQQMESTVRSKVWFRVRKGIDICVLVRGANSQATAQEDLAEMAGKFRLVPGRAHLIHKRLRPVEGHIAADVAGRIGTVGQGFAMRVVGYRKHGYSHQLTLMCPEGSLQVSSKLLDGILATYQSIDPDEKARLARERKLPPSLDYVLR